MNDLYLVETSHLNVRRIADKTSIAFANQLIPQMIWSSASFAVKFCYYLWFFSQLWFLKDDWYHYGCVGFVKKESDDEGEMYRCPMCNDWCAKKKRLNKEMQSNKPDTFDIIPHNIPKFNLMDFVSILLFLDFRVHNLLNSQRKANT